MRERSVYIRTGEIKLDSFLKLAGAAQTGGQAKLLVQNGLVQVNGQLETRRGRKLKTGDVVTVNSEDRYIVCDQGSIGEGGS